MRSKDLFQKARYKRTHVYLEDRYEKPKYLFIVLADKIESIIGKNSGFSLLDIGSAKRNWSIWILSKKTIS